MSARRGRRAMGQPHDPAAVHRAKVARSGGPRRRVFALPDVLPDPDSADAARLYDTAWSFGAEAARTLLAAHLGVPVRGAITANAPGGIDNPAVQAWHAAQQRRVQARTA